MKKVVNWFSKKKKFSTNSHDLDADALPEPPRNIPRYVPKPINLHKTFWAGDCSSSNKTGNDNSDNRESEVREEQISENGNDGNIADLSSQSHDNLQEVVENERSSLPDNALQEIPRLALEALSQESQAITVADRLSVDSSDNLSRAGSANNMAVQEANLQQELPSNCVPKKLFSDKKTGGNTYVIKITKSTNFHIGTQKTINYSGAEDNSVYKKEFQFTNISNGKLLALNWDQMLNIKDRLSEDDLVKISLCIRDKWQEFARNLGVDESTIDELEDLNGNDYNLIVYDVLKQYLSRYPDTTVGFMVNILRKTNEVEAIRKITEKR